MEIKGYATFKPGTCLEPFTYPAQELKPFEILIKVTHCGLCHTDLYMIENGWKRSSYPLLPGHEIVGTVIKKGALSQKEIDDRVGVGWIYSSCLSCPECIQGDTNICQKKTGIYNQGHFGGFATHVIADSRFSYIIPKSLDSAHAAPLLCAGATVYSALKKHKIKEGMSIGVIGIGGLGHLAIQFAKALGAEVSAISSTKGKELETKQLGAEHFYTFDNPPNNNTFDYLLCTVDASLDWNQILLFLRPNGILCLVSRPQQGFTFDPMNLVSTQRTICGSNNANQEMMNEMLGFAAAHGILPWIEQMPLSKINMAIKKLKNNQARYRIVLYTDEN